VPSSVASSQTTYYVYDEDGSPSPLIEEQMNSGTAAVSMGWGMGADGLRARYSPTTGGPNYLFEYDPQGSLVQRQTGGNTSYSALDTAMYDAYGSKLNDVDVFTGGAEPVRDAVGFQGQFGAYTDNETGLVLMGHRYYSPGTGRFLTRDPKGYGGGINLYGFTGNNPVNESDAEGLQGIDPGQREIQNAAAMDALDYGTSYDQAYRQQYRAYYKGRAESFQRGMKAADWISTGLSMADGFGEIRLGWAALRAAAAGAGARVAARAAAKQAARKAGAGVIREAEIKSGVALKASKAVEEWNSFLGSGLKSNINPRTGMAQDDMIFSQVGPNRYRAIRFGDHEMGSTANKLHYHEHEFDYDPIMNKWTISNVMRRVIINK